MTKVERMERRVSLLKQEKKQNTESVKKATSDFSVITTLVSTLSNEIAKGLQERRPHPSYCKKGRKMKYPSKAGLPKKIDTYQTSVVADSSLAWEAGMPVNIENSSGILVTLSSQSSSSEKKTLLTSVTLRAQGRIVPRWSYKPLSSVYQMEGTENIEDETFNKRHHKYEQEEKRRKKWDIQRLREMRIIEKLRKRHEEKKEAKKLKCNSEIKSYYSKPKDLRFIELCEKLPVVVFGKPVHSFKACEFSLPWLSNQETHDLWRKYKSSYHRNQKT
ncbi:male-specific lethal 1-like 1 isoform X2 [Limulus polyphemus]|uniref:Male-specific lethal 1-like 1 isoform X2 n=1 Tax=Limulus polyphemus TaxID=6850 RepID=A0ABM1TSE0_LIMPO|nr:male-specific lethal 1-like 1 isoform X2 [Limulus polyphemus]